MKKILYHYSSQQIHTGSPRVLMEVVGGLDRSLFAPYFLAMEEGALSRELAIRGCTMLQGESGQVSWVGWNRSLRNLSRLSRLLRQEEIDLVHLNELGWNSEVAFAAKASGVPVFFHIHNPERMGGRNLNCLIGSKYIFVSRALAETSCGGTLSHRVEILHNPVAVERFQGGRSIRREWELDDHLAVVGTVAQICRRKGIDILIETAELVLREIPQVRFFIAGPDGIGENEFASEMRERVTSRGLEGKILFLGPRDDIPDFLASLDIFFLPTRSEPFGMVIAEAMASSIPVVASRVGGIPEIIPSPEFGFTLDPDPRAFARAIASLVKRPELRRSIAEEGFRRVREEFDASVFNRKLKSLYLQALS